MGWIADLNWFALVFLAPIPLVLRSLALVNEVARISERDAG
ncbi:hypothetical protein [Shimia haliotis]|uniref:Uncharacterized protein n=1 Tax=Shimia haliotis TaxID=1280847 RepID=A0A1I4BI13_9RHOB|nr:hypothetical protein [Shimia haliotis]SFK68444.1 hypothetical protein SAMN04488036_1011052 [Shimia haliotis]